MAVAKTFQNMEIVEGPYVENGRQYVKVKHPTTGKLRQVRWYSEAEYNRKYPSDTTTIIADCTPHPYAKFQKKALGFEKGYITIFKGDTAAHLDWFRVSNARYARNWGWYIVSTEEIPEDLPDGIEPIELPWELVGNEDGSLKLEHVVRASVEALLYEESNSKHIGCLGERLTLKLTVERTIPLNNEYGCSTMHLMRDKDQNLFVWTTAAKSWAPGTVHHIRGTVKDHRIYHNEKQTILTRCKEVEAK